MSRDIDTILDGACCLLEDRGSQVTVLDSLRGIFRSLPGDCIDVSIASCPRKFVEVQVRCSTPGTAQLRITFDRWPSWLVVDEVVLGAGQGISVSLAAFRDSMEYLDDNRALEEFVKAVAAGRVRETIYFVGSRIYRTGFTIDLPGRVYEGTRTNVPLWLFSVLGRRTVREIAYAPYRQES